MIAPIKFMTQVPINTTPMNIAFSNPFPIPKTVLMLHLPSIHINKFIEYLFLNQLLNFRLPAVVLHKVSRPLIPFVFGELRVHGFIQLVRPTVYAV